MTRRIKILQLQPDYNVKPHGFADLAEQIVVGLPRERFDVVSAYLSGRPTGAQRESRAERSVYFDLSEAQLKGARFAALRAVYRFCVAEKFDAVICSRFKAISLMLLLSRLLPVRVCIAVVHGLSDYDRLYRRLQVRLLSDPRWRFVGVSSAVRQSLLDLGLTPQRTVAITNAIDIAGAEALMLDRAEARRELGLPQDGRVVGGIGRLVPVKGHVFLIRAFAQIAQSFPDVRLAIIGEGRERARLEREVDALGLAGRVHLPGALPDALRFIRAFDVFAMPSLEEGLGLALLEGMCGHLPVIASSVPAMKPLVEGAGGFAVLPGDEAALAEALATYLGLSRQELAQLGDRAYEYLSREHRIERYREQYKALIEECLDRVGAGR